MDRRRFALAGILLTVALGLLMGCSKDPNEAENSNEWQSASRELLTTMQLDVNELDAHQRDLAIGALHMADALFSTGVEREGSMKVFKHTLSEIVRIDNPTLPSTLLHRKTNMGLYAVNFKEGGYALVSGSGAHPFIWAIMPAGQFDPLEISSCSGQAMLFEHIGEAYSQGLDEAVGYNRYIGKDENPPLNKFVDTLEGPDLQEEFLDKSVVPGSEYGPLIKVVWGQGNPYNGLVQPYPAGCVPTAVAQVLAYYKKPKWYKWSLMLQHHPIDNPGHNEPKAYKELAILYQNLGRILEVEYDMDGSSASTEDAPKVFMDYSFSSPGRKTSYEIDAILSEIRSGHPVILRACDTRNTTHWNFLFFEWDYDSYSGGHAFVLDGTMTVKSHWRTVDRKTGIVFSDWYSYTDFVHANLGWNSPAYNGFYNPTIFDTKRVPYPDKEKRQTARSGEPRVYRYDFWTIRGIRP